MILHTSIDLKGVLAWPEDLFRQWFDKGVLDSQTGAPLTAAQVKAHFLDLLAEGTLCIPMGECEDFDFKGGGCRGHDRQEAVANG